MDIRILTPQERELAESLWRYCFGDTREFTGYYFGSRAGDVIAAMDGKNLAAQMVCVPSEFSIRGAVKPASILSGVATAPEYRMRGHMAGLMCEGLEILRGSGKAFLSLYPFDYGFYERFGFAGCGEIARVKAAIDRLPSKKPRGDIIPLRGGDSDPDMLVQAYEICFKGYGGRVVRGRNQFLQKLEELALDEGHSAVYSRENKIEGYILYRVSDKAVIADEIGAATDNARADILSFLSGHSSTAESAEFICPLDDPLWRLLPDPRGIVGAEPYCMFRILDIERALNGLSAPERAEATIRVVDPFAPWNEGVWRLWAASGAMRVERTECADAAEISIGELTRLAVEGSDREWGSIFPKNPVFTYDMY